jgi:hypothetical protein
MNLRWRNTILFSPIWQVLKVEAEQMAAQTKGLVQARQRKNTEKILRIYRLQQSTCQSEQADNLV